MGRRISAATLAARRLKVAEAAERAAEWRRRNARPVVVMDAEGRVIGELRVAKGKVQRETVWVLDERVGPEA
jgi:hypothetical protein